MKILSALPLGTTLVSPVTIVTPALSASDFMESSIRSRSSKGSPSSRMRAHEMKSGLAPMTARSFTVPFTASFPMSPPGKKIGVIVKVSVVKAMLRAADGKNGRVVKLDAVGCRNASG